ncbi:MAG: exodeoxyribonuclease VII small subunit [Planctomycetota bacterium]
MARRKDPSSPDEPASYKSAMEELESILERLQGEGEDAVPDIDSLASDVKRAATLIAWCQERLKRTKDEVASIVKDFAAGETEPDEGK